MKALDTTICAFDLPRLPEEINELMNGRGCKYDRVEILVEINQKKKKLFRKVAHGVKLKIANV